MHEKLMSICKIEKKAVNIKTNEKHSLVTTQQHRFGQERKIFVSAVTWLQH